MSKTLGVSMDALCFANSEGDLLVDGKGGGAAGLEQPAEETGIQELRGRYEVYLRRL